MSVTNGCTPGLTAKVKAWYPIPRNRIREVELADVFIKCNDLEAAAEGVKKAALSLLRRRRCEALRMTVEFKTTEGVQGKLSYLAEQ